MPEIELEKMQNDAIIVHCRGFCVCARSLAPFYMARKPMFSIMPFFSPDGNGTVMNRETEQISGPADAREKDELRRDLTVRRIRAAVVILLLFLLPFVLYHTFTRYMYHCTIAIPAGTTVVDQTMVPRASSLGKYIIGKIPRLRSYLEYRHYVIPDGATEIDRNAFSYKEELESVRIPDSVTTIRGGAFCKCENLKTVTLPRGITEIAPNTFRGCGSLTRIRIPEGVKRLRENAFRECAALRNVVLPESLHEIDNGVFRECASLSAVRIPGNVWKTGEYVFMGCTALREVSIPDGVEAIGEGTFSGCVSLEEIRLPAAMGRSLTEENKEDFRRRAEAEAAAIPPRTGVISVSPYFAILEPLPNARWIEQSLFRDCTGLKKVVIPDGVERICFSAFSGCVNLSEINLPDSVRTIDSCAFLGCRSLPPLTIGEEIMSIGSGAFSGTNCRLTVSGNRHFRLRDGILYSSDGESLISCVSVPEDGRVVVPPDVKNIGRSAFALCTGLKEIRLPEGAPDILRPYSYDVFRGCTGLEHVELPDSITELAPNMFQDCTALKSIRLPSSLKTIGNSLFQNCTQLEEIVIPDGVTKIGREAFAGCANLKRVTLPSGLTGIEYNVFGGCTSLEQVDIPESVKTIGECAFYGCSNLKRVTIPSGVTKIGNKAFEGTSVQMPKPDAPKAVPGAGTDLDTELLRHLLDQQLFGSYGTGRTGAEQADTAQTGTDAAAEKEKED